MNELVFIKWGGSLITDKSSPLTPKPEIIQALSEELAAILHAFPQTRFILGHGSGSFGHYVASQYGTREGVSGAQGWHGFHEVWKAVRELNNIVIAALNKNNIPCLALPPSATFTARDGIADSFYQQPFDQALQAGMIPVVFGDVVFDTLRNGTILSTEDQFFHLARHYKPQMILLAGIQEGIYADFPQSTQLISSITPRNFPQVKSAIGASGQLDVTGGMIEKVTIMLNLLADLPHLKIAVFSGSTPGNMLKAIQRQAIGTRIEMEMK